MVSMPELHKLVGAERYNALSQRYAADKED